MSGILHENLFNVHKDDLKNKIPNVVKNLLSFSNPVSSLGIKYPSLRDHPLKVGSLWLAGKRLDDNAEGLWRIHDNLYDFTDFVKFHPGGSDWLSLTKGTDITEAFECHHLSNLPNTMLPEYFIREAKTPRNYPFTFKEDGFYRVLKKEISEAIKTVPKQPANRSKYLTDLLFISYIALSLLAAYTRSYLLGTAAGLMLCLVSIAAHNFFHQKDNFRMYYFDFTMMQSKEWRISHALSHHLYPNTILDIEISSVEPFLQYLPNKNLLAFRYLSWLYSPIVWAFMFVGHSVKSFTRKFVFGETLELAQFLPFTVLFAMYMLTGASLLNCAVMFAWIITFGSIFFGLIGVNAGHHHPDSFHDGDAARPKDEMDWGIFQLDAVFDRKDISGSHFLVLISFGDHALHHMFPTIDHGLLEHLYPVFIRTCEKFGVEWRCRTSADCAKGQFKQLIKTEPNTIAHGVKRSLS